MRTAIAVAFSVCMLSTTAFAWGDAGHSIVAELAQRRLTATAAARVQELLRTDYDKPPAGMISLVAIASWADDYKFMPEGKRTQSWHFVEIPINVPGVRPEDVRYRPERDCQAAVGEQGCLVDALASQVAILSRPTAPGDKAAAKARAFALKMVVHLMGDLSQPLHCAHRDHDAGGNGLHVFYSGPNQPVGEVRTNLHAAWDDLIPRDRNYAWGKTVEELETKWLEGKDETALAAGDFESWANECHARAIEVYRLVPADLTLTKFQLKPALAILDAQMARAGLRLARILNETLAQ